MASPVVSREESSSDEVMREAIEEEGYDDGIARPTEELVIGMVGAVGAGVSTASLVLRGKLENEYRALRKIAPDLTAV